MELVKQIVVMILSLLSKENAKSLLDKLFDAVEDWVASTPNTVDDAIILPLIAKAREILDVPDNDA